MPRVTDEAAGHATAARNCSSLNRRRPKTPLGVDLGGSASSASSKCPKKMRRWVSLLVTDLEADPSLELGLRPACARFPHPAGVDLEPRPSSLNGAPAPCPAGGSPRAGAQRWGGPTGRPYGQRALAVRLAESAHAVWYRSESVHRDGSLPRPHDHDKGDSVSTTRRAPGRGSPRRLTDRPRRRGSWGRRKAWRRSEGRSTST